jgi:hypothetical protein
MSNGQFKLRRRRWLPLAMAHFVWLLRFTLGLAYALSGIVNCS